MNIQQITTIVINGGIIIFPTDTVMGIGCRIDNTDAIRRLFLLKKRDLSQAVPILVSSIEMAEKYVANIPQKVRKLMETYWPGGLTIILPADIEKVSPLISGNGNTIGLRMPAHSEVLTLIEKIGVPIIGTSANFHGESTPITQHDLDSRLLALVDGVLDGDGLGQKSSTVIDCSLSPWKVVRQGAVVVPML